MRTILRIALFILSFILILPRVLFNSPGTSLDGSWQLALHMAYQRGFIFGRDFIFTYGPLGIIQTRLPVGGVQNVILAADLFIYGNIIGLGIWAFKNFRSSFLWIIITFVSFIMSVAIYFMEPAIVLYILSLVYTCLYLERGSLYLLILASLCSIFVFYVKLNLGLCAFVIVIAGVIWRFVLGEKYSRTFSHVFISSSLLLISILLIPVDFPLYLRASIEIASGYNEAMGISVPDFEWLINPALIIWGLFILFGLVNFKNVFQRSNFPFLYGASLLSIFLLFKQSFVRADEHVYAIFEYAPILALVVLLFSFRKKSSWSLLIGVMSVSIFVSWDRLWPDQPLRKIDEIKKYFSSIGGEEYVSKYKGDVPLASQLPSEFVSAIKDSSVDSIPWDIASLFYNNLNYLPRPVIQSYSAYTSYLDGFSAEKYLSKSGPEFVIFFNGCIDGRYCWFDETKVKTSLMSNYEVKDFKGGKILFQRAKSQKKFRIETIKKGEGKVGEPVEVPVSEDPLLWTPNLKTTLSGTLQKIFFKPDAFRVRLKLEDGTTKRYGGILPILKGGVFVDHYVENTDEAKEYLSGKRDVLKQISSITIGSPSKKPLNSTFSYSFSKVIFE